MAWQDRISNAFAGGASTASTAGIFTADPITLGLAAIPGAVIGAFQDPSQQEQARAMARGQIDPVAQQALSRALDREFNIIRRQQGQDLARRGLTDSTIAGNAMGRIGDAQGFALAQGLAGHQFARQQLGAQMLAQQQFGQSQTVANAINALTMAQLVHKKNGRGTNLLDLVGQTQTLGLNAGSSRQIIGDTGLGGVQGHRGTGMNRGGHRNITSPKSPYGDFQPFMPPVGR